MNQFLRVLLLSCFLAVSIFFLVNTASGFTCTFLQNTSCPTGSARLIGLENDTEGYNNAHAQNNSFNTYNYSICCNSTSANITAGCPGNVTVINISNGTNAHIEIPSSNNYGIGICLGSDWKFVSCTYPTGSCAAGYACVLSMASSEGANTTNAHVGNCSHYSQKVCCKLENSPPTHTYPRINSSSGNNLTTDNLTCYNQSTSDPDGDGVTNIYNWYRNGTSITVLNMPFDTNVSTNDTGAVKDYSSYNNNGTLGGGNLSKVPIWNSSGKIGGAYVFDGVDDYIEIPDSPSVNITTNRITLSAWVKYTDAGGDTEGYVIKKGKFGASGPYTLSAHEDGVVYFTFSNGTDGIGVNWGGGIDDGNWHHLVGTYNGSQAIIYVDGIQRDNTSTNQNITTTSSVVTIGGWVDNYRIFNGTIDNPKIYNFALTGSQVWKMYVEENSSHTNYRTMVSQETETGEIWTCEITPTDGIDDGTALNSSLSLVANKAPTKPTLIYPADGNYSVFERTPNFNWTNSTDPESHSITYTLNLTCGSCSATCAEPNIGGITTSNYTISTALCVDTVYNWTVTACDVFNACNTSLIFDFNITSVANLELIINATNFGTMTNNENNDTTDDSPTPLVARNTGNVLLNVTINGTALFTSISMNTFYYQFKADENESGSYIGSCSQNLTFANMSTSPKNLFCNMSYVDANDEGEIELNITVPVTEGAGAKSSVMEVSHASVE